MNHTESCSCEICTAKRTCSFSGIGNGERDTEWNGKATQETTRCGCNDSAEAAPARCGCGDNTWKTPARCGCGDNTWKTPARCGCGDNTWRSYPRCGCGDNTWRSYPRCGCGDNTWRSYPRCGCGDNTRRSYPRCGCGDNTRRSYPRCGCGETSLRDRSCDPSTQWKSKDSCPASLTGTPPFEPQTCQNSGAVSQCTLKGKSLASVYAPHQEFHMLYDPREGLCNGTVFAELNLPFEGGKRCK